MLQNTLSAPIYILNIHNMNIKSQNIKSQKIHKNLLLNTHFPKLYNIMNWNVFFLGGGGTQPQKTKTTQKKPQKNPKNPQNSKVILKQEKEK